MQKKIIALALASLSSAAFAQSNVTISGLLDAGVMQTSGDTGTNSSLNAAYNMTGTSQVTVAAREDLGGGMRSGVVLETDIRGPSTLAGATTTSNNTAFGGFQHYVYIGKAGLGDLSFGQRTGMITTSAVTVQPFGTAMGGGYGGGFVRTRGGGFEAFGAWSALGRDLRPDGAMHIRSDSFSGISFGLDFKPTNSSAGETNASSGYTAFGLNYNNGPLNLTFSDSKAKNTTAAVASTVVSGACTAAQVAAGGVTGVGGDYCLTGAVAAYDSSIKNTVLGGNYAFGPMTVYAGWTRSKADTSAAAGDEQNSASWNIGLKYVMGQWAFLGNYTKDNNKLTKVATPTLSTDDDRKLFGLGVDYSLSKRTTTYFRYTTQDSDTNLSGVGKLRQMGVGLKHTF